MNFWKQLDELLVKHKRDLLAAKRFYPPGEAGERLLQRDRVALRSAA